MGERTTGVNEGEIGDGAVRTEEPAAAAPGNGAAKELDPHEIEEEIESIRGRLGELMSELDRRRHEALDIRLQASRHPVATLVVATAGALAVVGITTWIYRRIRPEPLAVRAEKLATALELIAKDPGKLVQLLEQRPNSRLPALLTPVIMKAATEMGKRAVTRS